MIMTLTTVQFSLAETPIKNASLPDKGENYLRATSEMLLFNSLLWAYDWYIKNYNWANISLDSMLYNIKNGYIWDVQYRNSFQCNQIEHPYTGAIYWGFARANGLNFWKSCIFPFTGNFLWEVFLENEQPSTNDAILTTCGGIALGEILFRIHGLITNENSTGIERWFRELMGFVINPAVGFNRLITGRVFRKGEYQKHNYNLDFSFGISKRSLMLGTNLEYNDALEKSNIDPYDYFRLEFRARTNKDGVKNEKILSSGLLAGKKMKILSNENNLVGLFAEFDYTNLPSNRISSVGIGPGLVANFSLGSNLNLNTFNSISGIFGGLSSSHVLKDCYFGTENDPYYLGPGISGKLDLRLEKKNFGDIYVNLSYYWVHPVLAKNTNEYLTRLCFGINYNLTKWAQVRLEYELYSKTGTYRDHPPLKAKSDALYLFYIIRF